MQSAAAAAAAEKEKGVAPNSPFNLAAYINHGGKLVRSLHNGDLLNLHILFLWRARSLARQTHSPCTCASSESIIVMHSSQGVSVK